MTSIELAAIAVAGTAVVLAPIDPQAVADLNTPAPPSTWEPTFDEALTRRVCTALGLRYGKPRPEEGETETRLTVWCQHELNAVYERAGGTVTTRTVQRTTHGGESTWDATEITVTVDLPGIGTVEIVTDWDEEDGGHDLPLMQAMPPAVEPLGDLTSGDALHTNPVAKHVRGWMTVNTAAAVSARADARAMAVSA